MLLRLGAPPERVGRQRVRGLLSRAEPARRYVVDAGSEWRQRCSSLRHQHINVSHCAQAWRFESRSSARAASGSCVGPSEKPAPGPPPWESAFGRPTRTYRGDNERPFAVLLTPAARAGCRLPPTMVLTAPKLRSPSLPLLHPRDPLARIVDLAERCPESLPAAAAWPTHIAWSVAEGAALSADIYLEKTLFDAFRPVNATVNAVRAVSWVTPPPAGPLTGRHRSCRCSQQ